MMTTSYPVLLVEDNDADVALMKEAVAELGLSYQIHECYEASEAWNRLRGNPGDAASSFDWVFLDLNLPGMDGRQLLSNIKEDASLAHVPVVVLTTSDAPEDVLDAYARGANCYLQKPMGFEKLKDLLRAFDAFWVRHAILPSRVR